MELSLIICLTVHIGIYCVALYLCNDYRKKLEASHERFIEAYKYGKKYSELYISESEKNMRLSALINMAEDEKKFQAIVSSTKSEEESK